MDGNRRRESTASIIGNTGSGDRRLGSRRGGCCFDVHRDWEAAVEVKPPPLNDISTIVRPQLPIPQWQDIDTAFGSWILRQFRKVGAKRRQQRIESAKRQAILAKFWRDEMQRTKPNMLYLISGASFEKVPEHWQGWWFADSQIRKAAQSLSCTYEQASAAFMAVKNRE